MPAATGARLSGFYGAYFLMVGVMMPFWPLWLDHKELTPVQIGMVLAASFWAKVAIQPMIAGWSDRRDAARGFARVLAAAAVIGFLMISQGDGFIAILVLATLTMALFSPSLPLVESITLRSADRWSLDYGRIRLWGSITFILSATGGGYLLADRSPDLIIWMMILGAGLVLVSALCLPLPPARASGEVQGSPLRLLRTPIFLIVATTGGLIAASHAVYNGFATLIWRSAGLSEGLIGGLWGTGVVAEIVLFALAGRFAGHVRPMTLLAIAAAAGIIRWPLLSMTNDPLLLFPLQTLHGLTFGAAHLGAMGFLRSAIPGSMAASGQAVYYSFGGIMMGAGMPLAGVLYGEHGGGAYMVMTIASGVGLIGALWLMRRWTGDRVILE